MKESRLYLNFFKNYFFYLLMPAIFGAILAFWLVNMKSPLFVVERMFEFPYNYENVSAVEKQSEEAVSILRSSQLKEQLGMQETKVVIFKPGPFLVKIQTKNQNGEIAVNNLDKLSAYALQNYPVREIGTEVSFIDKENPLRWIGLGFLSGFGAGLILSLVISYFKNY